MNIKAIGLISKSANGDILDVFFPVINFNGEKTEIDNLDNIESSKEIIELSWNQDNLDEPIRWCCFCLSKASFTVL